jgi:hypothetical protein
LSGFWGVLVSDGFERSWLDDLLNKERSQQVNQESDPSKKNPGPIHHPLNKLGKIPHTTQSQNTTTPAIKILIFYFPHI